MAKPAETKTLVLLDVHAIIHRAYHALPEFATSTGIPTGALYGLSTMLLKIIADIKPDYIAACYDLPKPTYRHEAYKDYKAGRAKTDEALIEQIKKSYEIFTAFGIPVYAKEGYEADDMIGTIAEESKKNKNLNIVIASGDMDTLQLVSGEKIRVYTLKKGIKDTIIYDEKGVNARYGFGPERIPDFKGLRGDPSDNIPGIKGIGEKTATELIEKFGSIEDIYRKLKKDKAAFAKAGVKDRIIGLLEAGEEEAAFSKMLGTINRHAPIAFSLPEKTWRENIDLEKTDAVFREFEFRTLGARLREMLGSKSKAESKRSGTETAEDFSTMTKMDETVAFSYPNLDRLSVMLWLVNSNIAAPTGEDVFQFTKTKDATEAEKILFAELEKRDLMRVWQWIEEPLIPIVKQMEENGIKVDKAELARLSAEYHEKLSAIEKKIWKLAGAEFNVNSPKQLGEVLFTKLGLAPKNQKKTGSGALSTKESELEKMRDMHPVVPLIFEYREYQKLLSTYIDAIPPMLDVGSRLHARFLQAGTTTGRMSSAEPNLQNIPNSTDLGRAIRAAFVPEKGAKLLALDYSQAELRIAAFLSGDEKMIGIFKKGEDVHSAVAAAVFNVPLDKVDHEMRRRAKVINFGIMYGMGVNALKSNLNSTREEAQRYLNDYFATFSTLAGYLDRLKIEAKEKGYTTTLFGRRRYFEGLRSKIPYIRAMAERMAVNAPIQGTEADFTKLAMVKIDGFLKKEKLEEKVKLILQVHDELVFEADEKVIDAVAPKIKKIMETLVPADATKGVVLKAEASEGKNWKEMKKLT
ncbi:MAG: hypothetical protein KGH93_01050 [Patescibacteria group bacterium]|nr:hypothetical protein [Patescibacteria group bacterium]MDE1945768.1 hypothetical protein [Patescibacteria group bacterium]